MARADSPWTFHAALSVFTRPLHGPSRLHLASLLVLRLTFAMASTALLLRLWPEITDEPLLHLAFPLALTAFPAHATARSLFPPVARVTTKPSSPPQSADTLPLAERWGPAIAGATVLAVCLCNSVLGVVIGQVLSAQWIVLWITTALLDLAAFETLATLLISLMDRVKRHGQASLEKQS
eukprot:CAMPEP_0116998286 /NCGR_PEP_ID=MMETSP0472-20121206/1415_1 /TAXON_ID=693140 ORGANISM="Tiarina fusus, Strain LIS" /NCGR_SAMPLE_ID=MMETSP0472 /ASSEMBLY_ACC=CAM_ASM_000603 /LENGTH=179 /DNA_ID=CAMNT_0004697401 /DNA_START=180 /DNA_END=719 /DNA_ORIENTATION=-